MIKRIDLRDLKDLNCSASKMETFQYFLMEVMEPGEEAELIVGDADSWYALRSLGKDLGYEVISTYKVGDNEYIVHIKVL